MKKCSNKNCNAENPDDAKYCHMCGEKIKENKIWGFIKDNNEVICSILGIILASAGSFLMRDAFWFGTSMVLIGFGMMVWVLIQDNL